MYKYVAFYPQKWRAPTWSWASTNVKGHPSSIRHHISCPNLQEKVTIESTDIEALDSGQLKHGSLTLRGKLLHATFVIRGPPFKYERLTQFICGNSSITGEHRNQSSFQLILENPSTELHYREDLVCVGMFAYAFQLASGNKAQHSHTRASHRTVLTSKSRRNQAINKQKQDRAKERRKS
ncbi:hypothetical protein N431DRAFT_451699 [Stipitochalara longipes BDJ]|nr:hypothetical protein N431DRAFT_451699 [Stipitochalara longipes BDJ]